MAENSGVSVTLAGDLSKPATALIEKVGSALGAVFEPRQIRRIAKAEADAKIEHARADLKITKMQESSDVELESLKDRTLRRMVAKEVKRQINIENTLAIAAQKLGETASGKDVNRSIESLEETFVQDVFSYAENVSDERLQECWAKILVSEVNDNSKTSKRTMQILSGMDRRDAELFQTFASLTWTIGGKPFCATGKKSLDTLKIRGIDFEEISHLEALGLLQVSNLSNYSFQGNITTGTTVSALYFGRSHILEFASSDFKIDVGKCLYTRAGGELLRVVGAEWQAGVEHATIEDLKAQGIKVKPSVTVSIVRSDVH